MALGLGSILGGAGIVCTALGGLAGMKEKSDKEKKEKEERLERENAFYNAVDAKLDDRVNVAVDNWFANHKS